MKGVKLMHSLNADTIMQIKKPTDSTKRPSFSCNNPFPDLAKLAEACWKERPEERLTFGAIKKIVTSLRR